MPELTITQDAIRKDLSVLVTEHLKMSACIPRRNHPSSYVSVGRGNYLSNMRQIRINRRTGEVTDLR
jgi:hypothetical protein